MDAATGNERRPTINMLERTVSVMTTSEVDDGRADQRHETAGLGTVEQDHAALETPSQPLKVD